MKTSLSTLVPWQKFHRLDKNDQHCLWKDSGILTLATCRQIPIQHHRELCYIQLCSFRKADMFHQTQHQPSIHLHPVIGIRSLIWPSVANWDNSVSKIVLTNSGRSFGHDDRKRFKFWCMVYWKNVWQLECCLRKIWIEIRPPTYKLLQTHHCLHRSHGDEEEYTLACLRIDYWMAWRVDLSHSVRSLMFMKKDFSKVFLPHNNPSVVCYCRCAKLELIPM